MAQLQYVGQTGDLVTVESSAGELRLLAGDLLRTDANRKINFVSDEESEGEAFKSFFSTHVGVVASTESQMDEQFEADQKAKEEAMKENPEQFADPARDAGGDETPLPTAMDHAPQQTVTQPPVEEEEEAEEAGTEGMTKDELIAEAESRGIEVPSRATKADVQKLLDENQ